MVLYCLETVACSACFLTVFDLNGCPSSSLDNCSKIDASSIVVGGICGSQCW